MGVGHHRPGQLDRHTGRLTVVERAGLVAKAAQALGPRSQDAVARAAAPREGVMKVLVPGAGRLMLVVDTSRVASAGVLRLHIRNVNRFSRAGTGMGGANVTELLVYDADMTVREAGE